MKKLKEAYNDIFSRGIENYWKDEGCNSRMQKYFKFANLLDDINVVLKYLMIICFNIIATITVFKLSSGIYLAEMVKETTTLTVMDVIFQQEGFIAIGLLYFVSGFRYGKLKKDKFGKIMFNVLYGMPMYYLIYLNMCLMDGMTGIMIFLIVYLIIVNINFIISKKIKDLYTVAKGNVGTEEHEKELEEVDVVFDKKEAFKDSKKGRGEKKYARKR